MENLDLIWPPSGDTAMKDVGHFTKIFVCTDTIDFRKQVYGLSVIVKESLNENPIDARCLVVFLKIDQPLYFTSID